MSDKKVKTETTRVVLEVTYTPHDEDLTPRHWDWDALGRKHLPLDKEESIRVVAQDEADALAVDYLRSKKAGDPEYQQLMGDVKEAFAVWQAATKWAEEAHAKFREAQAKLRHFNQQQEAEREKQTQEEIN